MSGLGRAWTDSATMLRRNMRHALRYPAMTLSTVLLPVVVLLLFAGVLGHTLGDGLHSASRGSGRYIDYVTPGIVLMTVASGCLATAVAVCVDMTGGIIDRFRTMAISRTALLSGHVLGGLAKTAVSTALVLGVALLLGFRPRAGALDWIAAFGLLTLIAFALTWLAVLIGLVSRTPESASNRPLLIQLLLFVSSAFVPAASLPGGVRWVAENQPFTPFVEAVRASLLGTPAGSSVRVTVLWSLGIALAAYVGARAAFDRPRAA